MNNDTITFGSVCSGIEAASVAWHPLGWRAAWLAEIEAAPSQVLAHHYPDVPNLGDMNLIPGLLRNGDIRAPDVFCGGTPCQAFSVAGLRNSLDDARGNLSLKFCDIANEIDIQRAATGLLPCTVFWENVPGVLSTKDNAFGCFLGQLAGEDCELVPPGGKWKDAGAVFGPQRAIAWRVLDAQYFGVAQRRRRVFVVASARNGFDPAAILFEFEGVRRDSAPRRSTGQETAGTLAARTDGGGFPGTDEACSGYIQPVASTGDISHCLNAGGMGRIDYETETMIVQPALPVALRGREGGGTAELGDDLANCLRASTGGGDKPHVLAPIAFDSRQQCVSSTEVFGALGSSSPQAQAVCITDPAPRYACLCGENFDDQHATGAGTLAPAECPNCGEEENIIDRWTLSVQGAPAVCVTGDITHTLKAEGFDASEDGTGRGQPIVAAHVPVCPTLRAGGNSTGGDRPPGTDVDTADSLLTVGMAVRRLTPMECERLQGFPDFYTAIPLPERRQDSTGVRVMADGPRYKALGNSWAVPVVRWIGRRIDQHLRDLDTQDQKTKRKA